MKKRRFNKSRILAALMSLCMIISLFNGIDLPHFFQNETIAQAENGGVTPDPDEYKDETLDYIWSKGTDTPDSTYWGAARPYYTCAAESEAKAKEGTFAQFGGVYKRTIFHVFAFAGDTICIGSSVKNSGIGSDNKLKNLETGTTEYPDKDSVDVIMTDPYGNTIPIDITDGAGFIAKPGNEFAAIKMQSQDDGTFKGNCTINSVEYEYTPYTYPVQETGVYTFEFHSYNMVGCPQKNTRSTDWSTYTDIGGLIAAINLTVFDEKGDKQTGRTYADFLSLQMGNVGGGVKDAYYVLTKDSFIYKMKFNGASPYTYNFFANNKGIYDSSTGEIIYTSVKDINNDNTFDEMGAAYKYPGTKDTDMLKSYYIFLEYPDDQLEGYLYEKAVQPDPATNLRFVSTVNVGDDKVPGAYVGAGGYFAFDVEEATTATLRLEFSGTSFTDKGKFAPVEISGAVTPHSTNYFYWDGKDGNGKVIPVGEYDIKDLAFTVTTKAGEIHFPIIDMEFAKDGITFTRLSHIYSKDGTRLDYDDNIYGKTKNLIYYDDSAIYYGEPAASTGHSESNMSLALNKTDNPWESMTEPNLTTYYNIINNAPKTFFQNKPGQYWTYNNMKSDGGEYIVRDKNSDYVNNNNIRVGDHSHTTNVVDYFDEDGNLIGTPTGDQQQMINYLNSATYPVGKSTGTGITYADNHTGITDAEKYVWTNVKNAQSTTDYAIANFWTFIPSQPAVASTEIENIEIIEKPDDSFDLTGRVFFDVKGDGKFNDMTTDGDYPLKDVTLNLYKKIGATETYNRANEYVEYKDGKITKLTADTFTSSNKNNVYKLIDTGLTTGEGMYRFTGLAYDPTNGTDYLYEVIKPGSSYSLTSGRTKANAVSRDKMYYGYYADKSYNAGYYGTEVQHIKVGGTGGVDPKVYGYNTSLAKPADNVTVCAVDVGYNYALMAKSLTAKKKWASSVATDSPTSVVYEVRYDTGTAKKQLYNFWTVSPITAWQNEDEYLPAKQQGGDVNDYYVSAEYYIKDGYIYKHEFARKASGDDYESFVGTTSRVKCDDLYKDGYSSDKPIDGIYTFLNLPDLNGDGSRNAWDLEKITTWETVDEKTAPYRAVLDKNETASGTEITVTNSQNHGTIEIFKYHDSNEEANALQGATFRVYEDDIATVKAAIEGGGSPPTPVGEGTTRSNGRVAFPDLVPTQTYTVYERFAPDGYRILERYHQVVPRGKAGITDEAAKALTVEFDGENCAKLYIGNAIADTEFKIRKQITGRAWQDNDRFEFIITPMFKAYSTDKSGFVLDDGENVIFGGSGTENIDNTKIDSMASDITDSSDSSVKIDNDSSYYSYTSKRPGGSGEYTITSSTEKVSKGLLIDGKDGTAKAAFCGAAFPYAGVYTFEISEEKPATAANDTLTYTSRVYTVQIKVVREFDEGRESDGIKNESNTHLTASVDSVTYKDTPTGSEQVFAGSSPVFVNEYHPAPAVQSTSYTIKKELSGRDWVSNDDIQDNFTINVKAVDSATADAIKANQLRIYGFERPEKTGVVAKNTDENGWECTFTKDSHANIPFTAFVFNDIEFPVKFVNDTTNEVEEPNPEWEPDSDDMKNFLDTHTAQTEPVEYWLDIFEDIPTEAVGGKLNGITYDAQHYYLHITLRNAEKTVSGGHTSAGEEEDGIIDEIDMALYHAAQTNNVSSLTDPVATCYTKAEVLEDTEWIKAETSPEGGTYDWFYIDDTGKLIKDDTHSSKPANANLLVRRWEKHDGVHLMTITNNYSAETTWTPKVQKVLNGRQWADNDSFTFEIICKEAKPSRTVACVDSYTMPAETSVTITNTTDAHTAPFGSITFNQPGTYIFKISETDHTGGSSITNDGPVYIKVTIEDNYDGTLKKTFEVVDSEGAAIADKTYNELDAITLTNTYKDEPKTFAFDIKKTIIGRNWKTDDSFIFTITLDEAAKKAITDGRLTMPDGLTPPETDSEAYTAEIAYADGGSSVKEVITKELGNITIKGLSADKDSAEYKFTITEVTADFEGKMLCRHNDITLTINVERAKDTNGIPTGLLNVSAYYTIDCEETTCFGSGDTDPTATIPFENICLGTLTVEKEVVSSNEDTMTFDFTVVFKFDNSGTNKFTKDEVKNITAKFGGESVTPTVSSDGYTYTYTFKLKHGEKITFSNILPYTTYTITEDKEPTDYMFLRIMDKDGENVYKEDNGQKVSGTIDIKNSPYEYTFISGKIHNLPSAGGTGSQLILLGGLALIIAAALFYTLFHKNDKRREAR